MDVLGIELPEIVVILVLALLVLGPQRLPEVARMLGRIYGQIRRAGGGITEHHSSRYHAL